MRKSGFVPEPGREYSPESDHSSTVFAGTVVKQVRASQALPSQALAPTGAALPETAAICLDKPGHDVLRLAMAACAVACPVPPVCWFLSSI